MWRCTAPLGPRSMDTLCSILMFMHRLRVRRCAGRQQLSRAGFQRGGPVGCLVGNHQHRHAESHLRVEPDFDDHRHCYAEHRSVDGGLQPRKSPDRNHPGANFIGKSGGSNGLVITGDNAGDSYQVSAGSISVNGVPIAFSNIGDRHDPDRSRQRYLSPDCGTRCGCDIERRYR